MNQPRLSVCIPNYNHSHYLPGAVEALLAQSLPPDEIIIVDDASTDGSVGVIEDLCRKSPKVKLLRNQVNQGCFRSQNRALAESTGHYVFFQAADDLVLPGYFSKVISSMTAHPSAGLGLTPLRFIDVGGHDIPYKRVPVHYTHERYVKIRKPVFLTPAEVLKRLKRQPWFLFGGPAVFRRDVVLEAGGWREDLGSVADWFGVHFAALKYGMGYVPEPLFAVRIVAGSFQDVTSRNPRGYIESLTRLLSLIQEDRLREVFPASFVYQKKRDFAYAAFRSSLVCGHRDLRKNLDALIPATSLADRLLLGCFDILLQAERLGLKLYCRRKHNELFGAGRILD